jgi:hypothetical protein
MFAAALAHVHALDPLEELALFAAVGTARRPGLLGLLFVAGLVLGWVAIGDSRVAGDEAELLGAAGKGGELGARLSRAENLLDERDGGVHGRWCRCAQRGHADLVLVADVGVDLRELVHDLEPGAVGLVVLERGRQASRMPVSSAGLPVYRGWARRLDRSVLTVTHGRASLQWIALTSSIGRSWMGWR